MTLAEIKDLIASLGFPIFVAVYFMWFGVKAIKAHTTALENLKDVLAKICAKLDIP
jgi:hypothetical protein